MVEQEIWQYYQQLHPGQVQLLAPEVVSFDNPSGLASFRNQTGITFPLLRQCADGVADTNLINPYNQRDNYVVINKQGIIRYHAYDIWLFGNRYHRNELRAVIDSLVLNPADVIDPRARTLMLTASPSPFTRLTTIEFSNPGPAERHARVTVHDLAGRIIATLHDSPVPPGVSRTAWDGRSDTGAAMQSGLYLVRGEIGEQRLTTRVFLVR